MLCHINTDPASQLNTFDSLIHELQQTVTVDNKSIHPSLPHINALLLQAVLTTRAVATSQVQPGLAFNGEKVAPGKRLTPQWRFQKTTKDPGRKKKGLIFRYLVN